LKVLSLLVLFGLPDAIGWAIFAKELRDGVDLFLDPFEKTFIVAV
jgi:hypothetical protein